MDTASNYSAGDPKKNSEAHKTSGLYSITKYCSRIMYNVILIRMQTPYWWYITFFLFVLRCAILWINNQFHIWNPTLDVLCESLLATIMGRHRVSIWKYGSLGVLFPQFSPSRLPIRHTIWWMSLGMGKWVPIH